jgi:hypothetical protein
LKNKKPWQFIENDSVLLDYIFHHPEDEERRNTQHTLLQKYCEAMEILLMKSEYSNANVAEFQGNIDDILLLMWNDQEPGRKGSQIIFVCLPAGILNI